MFRSLKFSSFKSDSTNVTMSKFLTDLETELRRQHESSIQTNTTATALAVQRPNPTPMEKKRKPFCSNGTHNPECTGHSPSECNQLNPSRGLAYHQRKIDKLNALASKKALLSVNGGVFDAIVLDSGASGHYLKCRDYFTSFRTINSAVYGANGSAIPILGTGSAVIQASTGPIFITEAFYAPALSNSLIPLSHYIRQGYSLLPTRNGSGFECVRGAHKLCIGDTSNHVLLIEIHHPSALSVVPSVQQTWLDRHRALGHPSLPYLKKSFPGLSVASFSCSNCDTAKMHRQPFAGSFPGVSKPLECIHMDLCGPITPSSRGGNLYFLKIIDGYSKYRFIFPMKKKSDTFAIFLRFLSQVETSTGNKLISVVSDNGGEFINKHFQDLFAANGIQHHTTAPYSPQQNPFAERGNRTTVERARAMLSTAGLPLSWWGEAVTTSVYLENRSPDSSIRFRSPYELWHGTPPDLSRLVPFGCRAVVYVKKHNRRSKFDLTGVEAVFLGYDENHHSYKLWVPSTHEITVSHHVKFFPSVFPFLTSSSPRSISNTSLFDFPDFHDDHTPSTKPVDTPTSIPNTPVLESDPGLFPVPIPSESGPGLSPSPIPPTPSDTLDASVEPHEPVVDNPKGYAYVPHFDKAPNDITSSIDESNIIEGPRRR
jgi:transposase InsO family protein